MIYQTLFYLAGTKNEHELNDKVWPVSQGNNERKQMKERSENSMNIVG